MLARSFEEYRSTLAPELIATPPHAGGFPANADVFPHHADGIPPGTILSGGYEMRFAWTRTDLHAVQALRYRVFREETAAASEGSSTEPAALQRDEDERDPWFHHLMIVDRQSGAVVGTYRLQTAIMAATRFGFYSAAQFELGAIPGSILSDAVEAGRASVESAHRCGNVLRLLWRGIARYVQWNSKRYLFGCCSVPGLDPQSAIDSWRALHARKLMHDRILVRPRVEGRVLPDDGRTRPLISTEALTYRLPPLFEGYIALGARVCGAPSFDRAFNTTDYLVLLDTLTMDARTHRSLFR